MNRRVLLITTLVVIPLFLPECHAISVSVINNPILAVDNIRVHWTATEYSRVMDVSESLGFQTYIIEGDEILESDLSGKCILLICVPMEPYYKQDEIDLIIDFVEGGGGLYIIPFYYYKTHTIYGDLVVLNLVTYYNVLYDTFGFRLTGELTECSQTQNTFFTHPIMDQVYEVVVDCDQGSGMSKYNNKVAALSKLESPAMSIHENVDGSPLFLVSNYGKGKVFVDLTNVGIGSNDGYDNLRLVRNALTWLKWHSRLEVFRIDVNGEEKYDVSVSSNSILSNPTLNVDQKLLRFSVYGLRNTSGFINITIPKVVMSCDSIEDWSVKVDAKPPSDILKTQDAINTYLYFTYNHSTHDIEILATHVIPEFSSQVILPLFMVATLLAVIVYRRK